MVQPHCGRPAFFWLPTLASRPFQPDQKPLKRRSQSVSLAPVHPGNSSLPLPRRFVLCWPAHVRMHRVFLSPRCYAIIGVQVGGLLFFGQPRRIGKPSVHSLTLGSVSSTTVRHARRLLRRFCRDLYPLRGSLLVTIQIMLFGYFTPLLLPGTAQPCATGVAFRQSSFTCTTSPR